MHISSQITAVQRQRNALFDRMEAINADATQAERALTSAEEHEWARTQERVRELDADLARLHGDERRSAASARPMASPLGMPAVFNGNSGHRGKAGIAGLAFTRYVSALALSKGNLPQAVEISKRWNNDTPEVENVLTAAVRLGSTADQFWVQRAAVTIGTTTDPTWAAPLVQYQAMTEEFIELLRPQTIVGRLSGVQPIPFNVKIPRQTAGATANWVGEGLSKPVSRLSLDTITVPWAKIAVIVVITQELARFSQPSAELLVRNDLINSIAQFIDSQFLDPAIAPVAGLKPGSITNGVTPIPSTGGTVAAVITDLNAALLAVMNALQGNIGALVWIMSPHAALYLATLRTAQDIFAFPGMSAGGGSPGALGPAPNLFGVPVLVSSSVVVTGGKSSIILVDQREILLADDGQVTVDTSGEASVQMDNAPATPPTTLVSLWQQNLLGIKAERFIYWLMRRAGAVQVITGFPGP